MLLSARPTTDSSEDFEVFYLSHRIRLFRALVVTDPDGPAGSYQMVAVFGGADAPPGEAEYIWLYGPFTFEVTE